MAHDVQVEIAKNQTLTEVQILLEQQTLKGLEKYGHSVDVDEHTLIEWIDHAREECLDKLVYLTLMKQTIQRRGVTNESN